MITNEELKKAILDTVNTSTGINGVQLVMTVMNHVGPTSFETDTFKKIVKELIRDREVIKLKYTIQNRDYLFMYFPKETKFFNHENCG